MPERHVTWENFQRAFVEPAVPALHPIAGTPDVLLFVDADARRMGLHSEIPTGAPEPGSSSHKAIEVRVVVSGGRRLMEVSTSVRQFFPQFFSVLTDLADRIQLHGRTPSVALAEALRDWQRLLQETSRLSIERQIGLMGELWLLDRLRRTLGPTAIDAWVGPTGEPHDFRLARHEFEVKSTVQASRTHVINGLTQLTPSLGHQLYIVSLQFAPAGAADGESLTEVVNRVREEFAAHGLTGTFDDRLSQCGYNAEDADGYAARFRLRTPAALIPVDERCPALTQTAVSDVLGSAVGCRIRDISYTVDLGELGSLDGTPEFTMRIP